MSGEIIDYVKDNCGLVWTLVALLTLILEVYSGTFYILCFVIGASFAVVSTLFDTPLWAQVLVFVVLSVVSVFAVRPFVIKYVYGDTKERLSNVDALIGREGRVIEAIPARSTGYVRVDGDEWKAISVDGEPIDKGARVLIVSRDSLVVTVARLNKLS